MKRRLFLTGLLLAAFGATTAMAHSDDVLDTMKAANGGQLRMAGGWHFELVVAKEAQGAANSPIVVYVTDHGTTKIPTQGASGTATILYGKEKVVVPLLADGDNRLKGAGPYAADPKMKVIVSVSLGGKTEQARFTPLAKPEGDGHTDHKH